MSLLEMFSDVGKLFIGKVINDDISDLDDIEYDKDFDIKKFLKKCEKEGIIDSQDAELLTKTTEISEKRAKESFDLRNSKAKKNDEGISNKIALSNGENIGNQPLLSRNEKDNQEERGDR